MEYWVYEFWDRFLEMQVNPAIKIWSLNSNLRIGSSPELEAWHKRNIWFGVDHDMTKEALKYHEEILNSYLIELLNILKFTISFLLLPRLNYQHHDPEFFPTRLLWFADC